MAELDRRIVFTGDKNLYRVDGLTDTEMADVEEQYDRLKALSVPQLLEVARRRMVVASERGQMSPDSWMQLASVGQEVQV
jgi:hypothetical protein